MARQQDARSAVDCVFFTQGRCGKGDACPFNHNQVAAAGLQVFQASAFCRYFNTIEGCKYGPSCPFKHQKIPGMQIPRQAPEFPLEARLDMALGAAPVRRGPAPPAYPEAFNITLDEPAQPPAQMRTLTPSEARQVALGRDFAPAGYSPGGRTLGVAGPRGPFTGTPAPARTQAVEQQIPYRQGVQQRQLPEAARAGSHAHGPAAHRGSVQPPPPAQPRVVRAAEPSKRYSVFDRLANEEQNLQFKAHAAAELPAYAARQGPHSTVQVKIGKRKTVEEGGTDERGVRMIGDAARQGYRQSDGGDSRPTKRMSGEGAQDSSRIADRLTLPRADGRQAPLHLQNSTVVMATRLSTASRLRPPAPIPAAAQQAPAVRSVVSMRVAQKAADPQPSTARDTRPLLDRPLSDRSRRTEAKLAPKVKTLEELRKEKQMKQQQQQQQQKQQQPQQQQQKHQGASGVVKAAGIAASVKVARAGANGSASGPIAKNKAAAVPSPTPQGAVRPQAPSSAAAPAALQEEVISPVVVPESAVEAQQDDFLWDAEGIDDKIAEDDFGAEVETDDPAAPELDYSKQMAELQEAFEN